MYTAKEFWGISSKYPNNTKEIKMTNICETIKELENLLTNEGRGEELKRILKMTLDTNSIKVELSDDNKKSLGDYITAVDDALGCVDPLAIEKIGDGWEGLICLGNLLAIVDYLVDREEIEVSIVENNKVIISINMNADDYLPIVERLQYTQWLDDCHNGRV